MKYILINIIFILIACGKQEIEPVAKKTLASNDIDGDGLSQVQENELGSHEKIADIPHIILKSEGNYQFQLSYNLNSEQKQVTINGEIGDFENSHFLKETSELAFSAQNGITPTAATIELELGYVETQSKIQLNQITDLVIDLYIEDHLGQHTLLKDYKINSYNLGDKVQISQQSVSPQALLNLLYHRKNILVRIKDFEFEHPVTKDEFKYSELVKKIKKLNAEVTLQEELFDFSIYYSEVEFSELVNYYSLNSVGSPQSNLKLGSSSFIVSETRQHHRQSKREIKSLGKLERKNGSPVASHKDLWTASNEVLIELLGSRNVFETVRHTYQIPSILVPSGKCSLQLRRVGSTQRPKLSYELLRTLISFNSIREVIEIDPYKWIVLTQGPLSWSIPNASSNQVISGDINKTCLPFAQFIKNYDAAKTSYIESNLTLNLYEASMANASEQ